MQPSASDQQIGLNYGVTTCKALGASGLYGLADCPGANVATPTSLPAGVTLPAAAATASPTAKPGAASRAVAIGAAGLVSVAAIVLGSLAL